MTLTRVCPKCGQVLLIRTVKQTGERFLGCPSYPKCPHVEPLPAYFHMVESGNPMLPGMEDV